MLETSQPGYNPTAVSRFQHDVLDHPGVTDVIVLLGTNDLGRAADANNNTLITQDITDAYQTLIAMAHNHNPPVKIHGGTVTPFGSYTGGPEGYTGGGWASETARLAVNTWIRTTSASQGGFDDFIDFSSALAAAPGAAPSTTVPGDQAIVPICTHDGVHPTSQGYQVMGTLAYDVLYGTNTQPLVSCNGVSFSSLSPLIPTN
jgi:lysophospholipase L1-like esterase